MSGKSKYEYIGEKRRAYEKAGKAKRSRILDEVCETLGYTRKYVIKLIRKYQTGGPRTPYRRVLESGVLDEESVV